MDFKKNQKEKTEVISLQVDQKFKNTIEDLKKIYNFKFNSNAIKLALSLTHLLTKYIDSKDNSLTFLNNGAVTKIIIDSEVRE